MLNFLRILLIIVMNITRVKGNPKRLVVARKPSGLNEIENLAKEDQFTYMVSIENKNEHRCGGGILDDQFVLTAAHCVINKQGLFIRTKLRAVMNITNIYHPSDLVIKRDVKEIYVLKNYRPQDIRPNSINRVVSDVAVLKLTNPIRNSKLTKLSLPKKSLGLLVNAEAIITGFGLNWIKLYNPNTTEEYEEGRTDGNLRYGRVKILSNEICNKELDAKIHDTNICARMIQLYPGYSAGVCSGDSGGPLVFYGNIVIGILSSSPVGCNETVGAGVYTRVSSYIQFINNSMNSIKNDEMRVANWHAPDSYYEE